MTQMIDRLPVSTDLVAIAQRASLYELLLSAMQRQHKPQQLPSRLHADLGLPPSREREFVPRNR